MVFGQLVDTSCERDFFNSRVFDLAAQGLDKFVGINDLIGPVEVSGDLGGNCPWNIATLMQEADLLKQLT